jgi:hypothetical protein
MTANQGPEGEAAMTNERNEKAAAEMMDQESAGAAEHDNTRPLHDDELAVVSGGLYTAAELAAIAECGNTTLKKF